MSKEFREFLKKIGSGQHTSQNLTQLEAQQATKMMLKEEATPAQIGAFLIAHRIKRPTGTELAGMLDGYDNLMTKIPLSSNFNHKVRVLGIPYDGRSRNAPINPLTALILAIANVPVIMHGGGRIPTKYGIPLVEIWQGLGLDFSNISLNKVETIFNQTNFAFFYTPKHFPLMQNLVTYREEIGKRPPLATIELILSPYQGETHIIGGFVHPPTESMIREAFQLRGQKCYSLVKGLEGSIDLRLSQTTIVVTPNTENLTGVEYLKLNPRDYSFNSSEITLESNEIYLSQLQSLIEGKASPLMNSAIWNGGFYLWHCGISSTLESGLEMAENWLKTRVILDKLNQIKSLLINN